MNNFTFYNPVKVVFGRETIKELKSLLPADKRILMVYGGGSIKRNGVYNQVIEATKGFDLLEYGGIESNPEYETCLKVIDYIKQEGVQFILAVGGGSVIDAVKFIAAGAFSQSEDLWNDIVISGEVEGALPYGAVLTIPATGSEMNPSSVISYRKLGRKNAFMSDHVYPQFSIMDPETTYSLPERQIANGLVDAFVHIFEQYMTTDLDTPVQDRWAESLLLTLIELGRGVIENRDDYNRRANFMWTATCALNGFIGMGVDQDWATHRIGHEVTALYGVDHAQSLALVLPGLLSIQRKNKEKKLLQYADRVWGVKQGDKNVIIDEVITRTSIFFQSLGISGLFVDYQIDPKEAAEKIGNYFSESNIVLGEHEDITGEVVKKILLNRQCLY